MLTILIFNVTIFISIWFFAMSLIDKISIMSKPKKNIIIPVVGLRIVIIMLSLTVLYILLTFVSNNYSDLTSYYKWNQIKDTTAVFSGVSPIDDNFDYDEEMNRVNEASYDFITNNPGVMVTRGTKSNSNSSSSKFHFVNNQYLSLNPLLDSKGDEITGLQQDTVLISSDYFDNRTVLVDELLEYMYRGETYDGAYDNLKVIEIGSNQTLFPYLIGYDEAFFDANIVFVDVSHQMPKQIYADAILYQGFFTFSSIEEVVNYIETNNYEYYLRNPRYKYRDFTQSNLKLSLTLILLLVFSTFILIINTIINRSIIGLIFKTNGKVIMIKKLSGFNNYELYAKYIIYLALPYIITIALTWLIVLLYNHNNSISIMYEKIILGSLVFMIFDCILFFFEITKYTKSNKIEIIKELNANNR